MRRLSKAEIRAIQPLIEAAVNKAMRVPAYRRARPEVRRRATAKLTLDLRGAIVTDDLVREANKIATELVAAEAERRHRERYSGLIGKLRRVCDFLFC